MLFSSLFWSNFDNTNTIVVTEGQWSEGEKGTCSPWLVAPPEEDPFYIDLAKTDDPISLIKKLLKKIGREIIRLATIKSTTQEIRDRGSELLHTSETLKVSINEIFNYNKSSIMVFMLCSFI